MKKHYIIYLLLLSLTFVSNSIMAQLPMSAYYLENVPQSNYLNAAMTPRANVYVGLPFGSTIYTSVNSDLSTADLFQKEGTSWLTPLNSGYDYSKIYQKMGKAANIDLHQTVAPLMLGFRTKKGYVTFGIIDKADGNIALPKSFFTMIEKGLPNGSKFDLSPLNLNLSYYREFALGYSRDITDRLTIGAHAKMLFGVATISTNIESFDFNVSTDEWSYNLDGQINGSFPIDSLIIGDGGFVEDYTIPEINGDFIIENMVTNFGNPGFAIDIGATYELNEDWSFSAALNDLGLISWKENINNFNATGKFVFEGLEYSIDELGGGDSESGSGDFATDIIDSLMNSIQYSHTSDPFKTFTTPRLFIGAEYTVTHYFSAGAVARSTFYKNNFQQEVNVSANLNLYHFLTTSLNYNFSLRGRNSLGLGIAMRASIFQLYFIADYVPYSYRTYVIESEDDNGVISRQEIPGPEKLDNLNLMFGLNFLFGANGFQDEPMIDAYSEF